MAKKPKRDDDTVLVMAAAGFKYDDQYIRTGETVRMRKADAEEMALLNMVRILVEAA
jgi:hypothetical protein